MSRSDEGRITGIDRDGETTSFDYDEACQLVEARSGTVTRWRFDAAGRLVAESRDGAAVEHAYDAAGQLVDEPTRRREQHPPLLRPRSDAGSAPRQSDGRVRDYGWSVTSRLTDVVDATDDGDRADPAHPGPRRRDR